MSLQAVQAVKAAPPTVLVPKQRLMRLPEVEDACGCKKSTIYMLMKQGKFPRCVYITPRMVAWPEVEVRAWIQSRIEGGAA